MRRPPFLLALLALSAAALLGCGGADPPTGGAEWIWADLPSRTVTPRAFYAVRDFRLDAVPPGAELRVQADEEYLLHLNGRRVGSNRYRAGAPLDVYPVGGLLHPGANRLVAELRSGRGYGGFLAALVDGDGEPLLVSDTSWRILHRHRPGLVEGRAVLTGGEAARTWGRPPVGRWPMPELGPVRPTTVECGEPCEPRPAAEVTGVSEGVRRFDFGEEVTGYAVLRRGVEAAGEGLALGLVEVGVAPANPMASPRRALPLMGVAGSVEWSDVVARRFRYVTVAGLEEGVTAEVVRVEEEALGLLPGWEGEAGDGGLFGLETHWRRSAVESIVRRKLLGDGAGER